MACTGAGGPKRSGEREVIAAVGDTETVTAPDAPGEREREIGREGAQQIIAESGVLADPEIGATVTRIGKRLVAMSPMRGARFEFQVLDTDDVNAFALPGGYIFVTRGLIALTNSEAELANVLAHEVGHVTARHFARGQARRMRVGVLSGVGLLAAAVLGGGEAAQLVGALTQVGGAGLIAKYGREQEREADAVGQRIAARAGWDPAGMSQFLETLGRDTSLEVGDRRSSFLDSHPATDERVVSTAAQARALATAAPTPEDRGVLLDRDAYLDLIEGVAVGKDPEQGLFDEEVFRHPDFDFHLEFPSGWRTKNEASSVGAISQNEGAFIKLTLQGEGDDPRVAAAEYMGGLQGQVVRQNGMRIGDLKAFRAIVMQEQSAVEITWIAHRNLVFRLTGVTDRETYKGAYQRLFQETARSFRPLTKSERDAIRDVTLETVRAKKGETLRALSERTGNTWTVEKTAVANAILAFDPLEEGQRIKIAVARPYLPKEL